MRRAIRLRGLDMLRWMLDSKCTLVGNGCLRWDGQLGNNGYGVVKYCGKSRWAHRLSLILALNLDIDSLSRKIQVCHHCDFGRCLNPDHLYLGTHQDNMNDKVSRDRCSKGERHTASRLTNAQVLEIRKLRSYGESMALIASKINVCPSTVCNVINRRFWRHVEEVPSATN